MFLALEIQQLLKKTSTKYLDRIQNIKFWLQLVIFEFGWSLFCLRKWFSGGLGCVGLTAGLNDLEGIFQPK